MNFDIQKDNEDVESMVEAAKTNKWNTVFEILNKKPHLINCIPEDRAWSALHQAVYYEKKPIVSKLLDYKTCDAIVRSKQCHNDDLAPSSTPTDLAKLKGNNDIEILLKQHIDTRRPDRFKDDYPQYKKRDAGQDISEMGFPLLVLGVVMYKNSLLYPHVEIKKHSVHLFKKIFDNESHNWELTEKQLYQALYGHCRASAEFLKDALVNSESKFFWTLISLYTSIHVYGAVNLALKQEFNPDYKPTAENLSLGLYALLLDITLTYWTDLEKVKDETYRGIPIKVTTDYNVGNEIMFTSMLSSSKDRDVAEGFRFDKKTKEKGTLFIFDNTKELLERSKHPRYIAKHSEYEYEKECLYVLGTLFKVEEVDIRLHTVKLRLL